jgi:hypothetical protein
MHFKEALRIAAHHTGLAGRPDARLNPLALPFALGAAIMVMSLLDPSFFLLGAAFWLYGAAALAAGSLARRRQRGLGRRRQSALGRHRSGMRAS